MLTGVLKQISRRGIGVSLEVDALRMAESHGGRLLRCASKPYPPGISPTSEAFPAFLKQSLAGFSSRIRTAPVWVTGCLSSLQVRYLALPVLKQGSVSDMVYWTFRKDLPFDATQTLFDYGVERLEGSGAEARLHVTAYTALREETDAYVALFAKAGIRLSGVVIPTFGMRAMMKALMEGTPGTQIGLFAAEDASTVVIVKDGKVQSSRVFKTGMNAILGVISDHELNVAPAVAYHRIQSAFSESSRDDVIMNRVREVFGRLVQQIERTVGAYLVDHPDAVIGGLHVMGALAGLDTLVKEMGSRLGVELVETPALGINWTDEDTRGMTAMAAGVSLSRLENTPNLLCPSAQREKAARRSWWSLLVALLLGLIGALLCLYKGVLDLGNHSLSNRLDTERTQLAAYTPPVDHPMIQAFIAKTLIESQTLKGMSLRWLPLAALRALADVTPPTIRLTAVNADFSKEAMAEGKRGGSGGGDLSRSGRLRLRGLVRGPQDVQRSTLVAYAMRLEDSPLFSKTVVANTSDGMEGGDSVVVFEIDLDVAGTIGADAVAPAPVKEVNP